MPAQGNRVTQSQWVSSASSRVLGLSNKGPTDYGQARTGLMITKPAHVNHLFVHCIHAVYATHLLVT